MSGFSFSLKKVAKPAPKNQKKTVKPLNLLMEEEPREDKTQIDAFDASRGAMSGATAVSEKPRLVIKPSLSTRLRIPHARETASAESANSPGKDAPAAQSAEERARRSLLAGDTEFAGTAIAIAAEDDVDITEQDYDSVPVDDFGAALLRGMGWTGESTEQESKLHNRKRGVVMGIGAKSVEKGLEQEVMSKHATAPLRKRGNNVHNS